MEDNMVDSDALAIAMAIGSILLLVMVILVFLIGLLKKRETMKDTILMCNMMLAFLSYAVFQMISIVLKTLVEKDESLKAESATWCKFVGAIGLFAISSSLGATLIFAFHIFYDQVQSETSKRNKHTFIKVSIVIEYLILIIVAAIPCLPIDNFKHVCIEGTLCLPLNATGDTTLKVWTISLLTVDVLMAVITIAILVFVSYRMHHQLGLISTMIPMEARVLRKKATKIKRIGLLLLIVLAFRLPGVGVLLVLSLNMDISAMTIQWVYGFIIPLGGIVACTLYLIMVGCKNSMQSRCFKFRPREYEATVESLSGNQTVSANFYSSANEESSVVNYDKSPTKGKSFKRLFSGTVPGEVSWIRDALIPDKFTGRYGIVEWQTANGSPRRGLMKVYPPQQYKLWTWESSTLAKLNRLGHHDNIVDFLWATTSTSCRIEHQRAESNTDNLKLERYLCTAFYPHGTLREVLQAYPNKFRENLAHNALLQIAKGILYLHDNNMSHQDLNTQNIHVGGKIETMNLRIVINNFSKALDLSKQNQRKREEFSDFTIYQEIDGPKDKTDVKDPSNENVQMVVEEVQRLYGNDVRAFALIMLEVLETVRLHFLPKEMCIQFSEDNCKSLVPEITIPRLPSAEYEFDTAPPPPTKKRESDDGIVDSEFNSHVFRGVVDTLPTAAEMNIDSDTPKRNSVCSSDSGISSNRASMRSKGSSVGNSFSKKGRKVEKGMKDNPKPKISKLSQIKRRALARESSADIETDTTEVADSSNSSVEELDRVGYLPNFQKDRRSDSGPTSPPSHPVGYELRKGSLPTPTIHTNPLGNMPNVYRKTVKSENLDEGSNINDAPSALPRSSNSFSKFYVIRSREGHKGNELAGSPRVMSRHRSSPIQENVTSESESDTRSTPDDIPLSAIGRGFYEGTSNFNSLPRGGSKVITTEDKLIESYQSATSRRKSDFTTTNITPGMDLSMYGQHSLPRRPKKLSDERCPSNITNRHMLQCQEMLSIMDSLRAITLMNRIHVKEDCHKMLMRWLATQKADTCLYKQMTQILKSAWAREPPYIAGIIFRKLDNCLTEVDL